MKNLFAKVTALAIGSMIVFSGQALAKSSNNTEFTNADALGNSKSVIAQSQGVSVGAAVAISIQALGEAVTVVESAVVSQEISPEVLAFVSPRLRAAQSSLATAESSAQRGDNAEVARAVGTAISVLGESVQALAEANTPSAQAIAEVILTATSAQALAQGQASTQSL